MKKQGIFTVLAAVVIQLTLGIAYIWGVFQTGVANSVFGGDNAQAALTFSILLLALAIGSLAGGKLAIKYSTRLVVFIGGIILFAGFFIASLVTADVSWLMWVSYGLMGGIGMGFTYSTTIACAQKWYPHKKGLITGIIVSSLGFGGVIFAPIAEYALIPAFGGVGIGEAKTFMVLSFVFLAACSGGSYFLKNPPDGYMADVSAPETKKSGAQTPPPTVQDLTPVQMLKKPQYYLVTLTFALACMGGLMMIGFAKPIAQAKGLAEAAAVGVIVVAMFNSVGRLFWGMISDKLGSIMTIIILLSGTALLSLLVNAAGGYMIFVLIAFIGFFYGGLLSNFPSLTSDLFGPKNMATNYGFVLLGFGVGAVISSYIAGHFKNVAAEDINLMFPAFVIASCCAVVGIALMLFLRVMTKRKSHNL